MINPTHHDPYVPLPYDVTIKNSSIHGLGLFAKWAIPYEHNLGMIHYYVDDFEIIRTPLGGFLNHSDTPNCIKVIKSTIVGKRAFLIANTEILCGEELTITYDLYKV
jgi:hypothetical protein